MAEQKDLPMAERKQSGCGCGCMEPPQKDARVVKPATEESKKKALQ